MHPSQNKMPKQSPKYSSQPRYTVFSPQARFSHTRELSTRDQINNASSPRNTMPNNFNSELSQASNQSYDLKVFHHKNSTTFIYPQKTQLNFKKNADVNQFFKKHIAEKVDSLTYHLKGVQMIDSVEEFSLYPQQTPLSPTYFLKSKENSEDAIDSQRKAAKSIIIPAFDHSYHNGKTEKRNYVANYFQNKNQQANSKTLGNFYKKHTKKHQFCFTAGSSPFVDSKDKKNAPQGFTGIHFQAEETLDNTNSNSNRKKPKFFTHVKSANTSLSKLKPALQLENLDRYESHPISARTEYKMQLKKITNNYSTPSSLQKKALKRNEEQQKFTYAPTYQSLQVNGQTSEKNKSFEKKTLSKLFSEKQFKLNRQFGNQNVRSTGTLQWHRPCINNDGRKGKYYLADQSSTNYTEIYCAKCAISFVQQGLEVDEMPIQNRKSAKSSLKQSPRQPKIASSFHLRTMLDMKFDEISRQKQKLNESFQQQLQQVDYYYKSIISHIEKQKKQDRQFILSLKNKNDKMCEDYQKELRKAIEKVNVMMQCGQIHGYVNVFEHTYKDQVRRIISLLEINLEVRNIPLFHEKTAQEMSLLAIKVIDQSLLLPLQTRNSKNKSLSHPKSHTFNNKHPLTIVISSPNGSIAETINSRNSFQDTAEFENFYQSPKNKNLQPKLPSPKKLKLSRERIKNKKLTVHLSQLVSLTEQAEQSENSPKNSYTIPDYYENQDTNNRNQPFRSLFGQQQTVILSPDRVKQSLEGLNPEKIEKSPSFSKDF